ncbi:hypothetical protein [Anatilimnocola floriformis]|uniref:hypothetical protein n=1 Tax=Anatilimnocola floriformis TaxID=2948575 RepID=UPI0020C22A79|nr:hypothetical protein [Anatilimnocola floriformis]
MEFLKRLQNWFSRAGRDENLMSKAMTLANEKQPEEAIKLYTELMRSTTASSETKARALFNRALAHSSRKDDTQAVADLKQLTAMTDIPENVRNAARTQLVRIQNRSVA